MNESNWWGVLYGVLSLTAVETTAIVLLAFGWIRHAEAAPPRTWTGDTNTGTVRQLFRDHDNDGGAA
jgi:hypothetical protein